MRHNKMRCTHFRDIATHDRDGSTMNNIELVKALHHIWNSGDLALIDSVYAHDFLAHWPASSEVPERRGIEGIRFGVERIRTAFPDWHEQVIDVFGSGDRVASRYAFHRHAPRRVLGH
jgi:ketosteroid isomerase-like protein